MRKGKKAVLMLIGSIAIAVLLVTWPYGAQTEVETAVVQYGDLIQTLLLNGMVRHTQEETYLSVREGTIADVYVVPGQFIRKGDLLMKMDTTEEEKMLAKIYEVKFLQNKALESMDHRAAAVVQNELTLSEQEAQLRRAVELSYLRAQADGVLEAVYVQNGQKVCAAAVLAASHGEGKQIVAETSSINTFTPGMAAVARTGSKETVLLLKRISATETNGTQLLFFETTDEAQIQEFHAGETLSIELATAVHPEKALFPLSAIDSNEMVWIVENGKVYHRKISFDEVNREFAAADATWSGKHIILLPDCYALQDGMEVQVKK